MKLTEWARSQGISYRTALNWFHAGTLPIPARQLPTGTILVDPDSAPGAACSTCGQPTPPASPADPEPAVVTREGWGPWKLVLDRSDLRPFDLDCAPGQPLSSYPIDLLTCKDSAEVLDWICQVAGRCWGNDAKLAGLVRALNDILQPQANLCSEGKPKRLSDRALREQLTAYAARSRTADAGSSR
jgi:hypothetical protein